MNRFRVLIIGQGGREHAIAKHLAADALVDKVFIAKGNAGTSSLGENVNISNLDFERIGDFCLERNVDTIVVGPEAPLVAGMYDFFQNHRTYSSIRVFGPSRNGALLEGSKDYAKSFMTRHHIPTAQFRSFVPEELEDALKYILELPLPLVIKADGLAGGKGVIIASSHEEGKLAIQRIFSGQFSEAGNKIVIEEFMEGIEFSVFVITDGKSYKIMPVAKDYKRIGVADTGLNTGGMGAVSPPPFVTKEILASVEDKIIQPTIDGLVMEDIDYYGFIYFGLMLCKDGQIKVVEYNCRMGDPESQVVFPRIKSSLMELIDNTFEGELNKSELEIDQRSAVTTVLVSGGYPEAYQKGKEIDFPKEELEGVYVYHSGTKKADGKVVTDGGRVLSVTGIGKSWQEARSKSQKMAEAITYEGKYFRNDIGFDLED